MQKFDLDTKPFTFETSTAMAGDLRSRRRRTVAITALRKDKATQFLQCLYETLKKLANDLVVVERNCKTASGQQQQFFIVLLLLQQKKKLVAFKANRPTLPWQHTILSISPRGTAAKNISCYYTHQLQ